MLRRQANALSPLDPSRPRNAAIQILALIQLGRIEEAVVEAENTAPLRHPNAVVQGAILLAFHLSGKAEMAKRAAQELTTRFPEFTSSAIGTRLPMMNRELSGLIASVLKSY